MRQKPIQLLLGLLIGLGSINQAYSENQQSNSLSKAATLEFILYGENQIRNWIGNNGHLSSHVPTGDAGLEWPRGSGNTSVFCSSFWVVGRINGDLRSAAGEFTSEWSPGIIPYDTQTQTPIGNTPVNTADHQIYLVRRGDVSDLNSVYYNREYATWPASEGAPARDGEHFIDHNQNGVWDPDEDFEDFNLNGSYDGPDGSFVTGEDPPLFSADAMAWYVINDWDQNTHANLWSTQPLGIEAQILLYTYTHDPMLANVQFHTITLVNKSGEQIDDTYYAYWCDADVGDATDDYTACDPELSLGYFYNATPSDQDYGLRPPAVGYSILQGPLVSSPGDTVRYAGESYIDQKTLEMTSHVKYTSSDPEHGDSETAWQAYNNMQGLSSQGNAYHVGFDPNQPTTTFQYDGDPVTGEGWTEYDDSSPGDRRSLMGVGPFDMPPWDDLNGNGRADFGEPGVQVIHSAISIGSGTNNLNAITAMKYFAAYARTTFEGEYQGVQPPQAPTFTASGYDQEIILNWHNGADVFESFSLGNYLFEGYELYQGTTSEGPWTRIMGFDIVNEVGTIVEEYIDENGLVQQMITHAGNNQGLEHLVSITTDALQSNEPLVNDQEYHFALSAYLYDAGSTPPTVETEYQVVSVQPRQIQGGFDPRDAVTVYHQGSAQATVAVEVLDPSHLSGGDYEVGFGFDSTTMEGNWYLLRDHNDQVDTLRTGDHTGGKFYNDGFELSISNVIYDAPQLNSTWEQTENIVGNFHETLELLAVSPGGVDSLAWTDASMTTMVHLDTLYGPGFYWDGFTLEDRGAETWFILQREVTHEVVIQAFASNFGGLGGDRMADIPGIGGGSDDIESLQGDLEIRFSEAGQNASLWNRTLDFQPVMTSVPFEIWDIEQNIQLCLGIFDINRTDSILDTTETGEPSLDLDWVTVIYKDYATHGDSLHSMLNNPNTGWCWQFNNNTVYSIGDVLILNFTNPVIPGVDFYNWTTSSVHTKGGPDVPGEFSLKDLRIYPNPFNPSTTIHYSIPGQADMTIRIYDLLGREVWHHRIDSHPPGYQSLQWNGVDGNGRQAASGVYIITLSTPEFRLVEKALLVH